MLKHWLGNTFCVAILVVGASLYGSALGMLYPRESPTRRVKSLNGIWKFRVSPNNDTEAGFKEEWFSKDFEQMEGTIDMPVPSSFNDVTVNASLRDYIGWVWYQTSFYHQPFQSRERTFIYFGAVDHFAIIWCNGQRVGEHKGGHVRFEHEITDFLDANNFLVVAVNNTLTNHTIPQGFYNVYKNNTFRYPKGYVTYSHDFDYFDYAGINRNVMLYTVPKIFIKNIEADVTSLHETEAAATLYYRITASTLSSYECTTSLNNQKGNVILKGLGCSGSMIIIGFQPWWPAFSNHKTVGYTYSLRVDLLAQGVTDTYILPNIGFRTVSWNSSHILINNEPIYIKGFGMHEDSDIRGRGYDPVIMMKDVNLLLWTHSNTIRTSHYPYSEEFIQQADKAGIMVILEVPACSLNVYDDEMLCEHTRVAREIVSKYRNHPSVIMWSLANEPTTSNNASDNYFGTLVKAIKHEGTDRPVTFVSSQQYNNDKAVKHVDVICLNRYSGWYQNPGELDLIEYQVKNEITAWHQTHNKPVIITEYGAGSVVGQHNVPALMWSEDYQSELLKRHFKAFDKLRQEGHLAGEMMWNFIDFNTPQEYIRPGRCVKGIFTRQRDPKAAASVIRDRYSKL